MQRAQERGKTPQARGASRTACLALACWSGALFAFALLSGCNTFQRSRDPKQPEPLYGEFHPKTFGNAPPPASKTTSSKSGNAGAIPALPAATSTGSSAAIASGDPLLGSRPLAIEDPGRAQPVAAWQGTKQLTSGQSAADMTPNLRPPIVQPHPLPPDPNAGVAVAGGARAAPPAWSAPPAAADFDQLQKELADRNVTSLRLEKYQGGCKVSCMAPKPFDRGVNRTYEATAPDYPSAIRAVLDQIDRERQPR
jgi:hypothetical protein